MTELISRKQAKRLVCLATVTAENVSEAATSARILPIGKLRYVPRTYLRKHRLKQKLFARGLS